MIITNNEGLPSAFYNACLRQYQRVEGTYSATEMLKGVPEILLMRRHEHEITQDCSDMVWLIWGTAVHAIMENHTKSPNVSEMELTAECYEIRLSGHIDLYDAKNKKISDYKTCSVWKIIFHDYEDWRRQLLIYCWLLRENGYECESGEIIALMKDHSKREAKNKPDYPQLPVKRIEFDFSDADLQEIEDFLAQKSSVINVYNDIPDEKLPPCTESERWAKPTTYAVMKKGRKTALRVLDSMEDAQEWMQENGGDEIEVRQGADIKCVDYCLACQYCPYWQKTYGGKE